MNIQFLKSGNKIHIKKANEGKFTDYCGGKVTDECILKAKASKNPKLVKRAVFAENSRKWSHKQGGVVKALGGWLSSLLNKASQLESLVGNFLNKNIGGNSIGGWGLTILSGIGNSINASDKREKQNALQELLRLLQIALQDANAALEVASYNLEVLQRFLNNLDNLNLLLELMYQTLQKLYLDALNSGNNSLATKLSKLLNALSNTNTSNNILWAGNTDATYALNNLNIAKANVKLAYYNSLLLPTSNIFNTAAAGLKNLQNTLPVDSYKLDKDTILSGIKEGGEVLNNLLLLKSESEEAIKNIKPLKEIKGLPSMNGSPAKLSKGGKVFGVSYNDPTDDTGKVSIKTKKLIKRKGIKYNIGGKNNGNV